MALTNCSAPTTAERIRSTCVRAGGALLALGDTQPVPTPLHNLLDDGSFAVAVAVGGEPAETGPDGVQAVLELADYAPLPLREPVRSLIWIRGRLQPVPLPAVHGLLDLIAAEDPNPTLLQVRTAVSAPPAEDHTAYTLLRLAVESVVVTYNKCGAPGAEAVDPAALLAARPDPFCALESTWIRHLDAAHRDVVARLASRLPARLRRGDVRPLGVDRYGLELRVESPDGDHDVRLPFSAPVDDVRGLNRAIRLLIGCPFRNGLPVGRH
jgi:hypothetical protein